MSTARHHAEWLSLVEINGPFLSLLVLLRVFPLEETIRLTKTPGIATEIGQHPDNKIRTDWKRVRDRVMSEAVRTKFAQHPELVEILRSTGASRLVAYTPGASYWGDGGDGQGQNRLGEILMEVR